MHSPEMATGLQSGRWTFWISVDVGWILCVHLSSCWVASASGSFFFWFWRVEASKRGAFQHRSPSLPFTSSLTNCVKCTPSCEDWKAVRPGCRWDL